MEYHKFTSPFNNFTIVWKGTEPILKIQRIFLSDSEQQAEIKTLNSFKQIKKGSTSSIISFGEKIRRFLEGEDIKFKLELLDFSICSKIQERVLLTDFQIPRGWVSTYKRIANHIGKLNGARVVGNSLAKNPFPIVIPCHRAIKSNGNLGGYQGGIEMKRKLLEMEGVKVSERGKVITERIYY
ncbi:MAG: methylated-DNA--[protein]-cysteine S-methyltransferase [Candidatus Thorarchaeota archaeon]